MANLELGELNSSRADGDRTRTEVRFTTDPFARADSLIQQTIENRANGFVILAKPVQLFDLAIIG